MLYHYYNANGYEAVLLEDFTKYIGLQEKQSLTATGLARSIYSSPLMKGFSIKYLVTTTETKNLPLKYSKDSLFVYELPNTLPRAFVSRMARYISNENVYDQIDHLKITKFTPRDEITISDYPNGFIPVSGFARIWSFVSESAKLAIECTMTDPGILVVSDIYYSGWHAISKGKRYQLIRGNKIFRTLGLPAGEYRGVNKLYIYYDPISIRLGILITLISLLGIGLIVSLKGMGKRMFYEKIVR
jgi:hypothetical protein